MDHCSSEGATVEIQSYLFKTKNFSSKQKFQNSKQFQFNFKSKYISISFQNQYPKFHFKIHLKNQIKMSENIELSYVWDHTIIKILNHDIQSKIGNMIKEWVVFNKLEDFNSLLEYTDDDFTPTGKLCYINENGEKLYRKLMKQFFNLRWYIQHLVDEYDYQYGDNEWTNPLHESNWTYRTNKQFMKYVNFTLKEMNPEQMKMNPIKPIIKVNTNEELDTEEGESNTNEQECTISIEEEEEFTTSEELPEDEYSTFSDMSKPNSESDINVDDTQHQENPQTPELQIHNTYNTTMHDKHNLIHDEYDTSENENTIEIETIEQYGEKIHETEESISTETSQVLAIFNKTIHHEDDSSDDKSVIKIDPPRENGEQENGKLDKLLTTTFQIEIENRKVEGLITYSTDQQIFKFKVNSWVVNIEFTLYELKCIIHAILQHMGFYYTTENPCVMMSVNHETKSCECIILHQDELYIASSTLQEIIHIVKEKHKIKINPHINQESNFPYDPGGTMIC